MRSKNYEVTYFLYSVYRISKDTLNKTNRQKVILYSCKNFPGPYEFSVALSILLFLFPRFFDQLTFLCK